MPRFLSLVCVGLLAAVAGTAGVAAGGRTPTPSRAERAATDARRIGTGARVKVTMLDGTTVRGVLVAIGDRDFDLLVTSGAQKGQRRLAYDGVNRIKKEGSHLPVWIALGVTIGLLLLPIGLCAAAA
jgi:hypothetical protein